MINKNHKGKVNRINQIAKDTFCLEISNDTIKEVKPGQFISILCANTTLRRPFSVSGFKNSIITIYFRLKGEGTEFLKNLKKNETIQFSGPFGNGFNIEKNKKSLLIGAGIGVAPLFYLQKKLNDTFFLSGFKVEEEVFGKYNYVKIGGTIFREIEEYYTKYTFQKIYACGPGVVLKYIGEFANKNKIDCELAFEKVMACSIGVCRGCVIKVQENSIIKNKTVCKDGPIFKACEVIW